MSLHTYRYLHMKKENSKELNERHDRVNLKIKFLCKSITIFTE